jgi:hypothetical protein
MAGFANHSPSLRLWGNLLIIIYSNLSTFTPIKTPGLPTAACWGNIRLGMEDVSLPWWIASRRKLWAQSIQTQSLDWSLLSPVCRLN